LFGAISFDSLGLFSPGALQSLCEAAQATLLQAGHKSAPCITNVHHKLAVVNSHYLSRMGMAAVVLRTASKGFSIIWIAPKQNPPPDVLEPPQLLLPLLPHDLPVVEAIPGHLSF
jgi:hypothetical protein